ncbi:hypothetical protein SBA1_480067 [Candidatus Sulfotelmatobacter kueseliae]|uniref:Uncharacterized protein n=1 Tax=Candidatus Sulfotelmatobacter kueseliae TaxID=2042962 RepID=A0A2U3KUF8_9BACT|nr:hypothetical protein SBA1_480067 [Candidatus Sulfotelmatobacter kueseliae]
MDGALRTVRKYLPHTHRSGRSGFESSTIANLSCLLDSVPRKRSISDSACFCGVPVCRDCECGTYGLRIPDSVKCGPKNNERPETLASPGRPGSPPPELLTAEAKREKPCCLWHFGAIGLPGSASLPSL